MPSRRLDVSRRAGFHYNGGNLHAASGVRRPRHLARLHRTLREIGMQPRRLAGMGLLIWTLICGIVTAQSESIAPLVETLRKVEREGKGNRAGHSAWAELTAQAGADQLPAILAGLDGADPLAANWLRAAVDAIAERQIAAGRQAARGGLGEVSQREAARSASPAIGVRMDRPQRPGGARSADSQDARRSEPGAAARRGRPRADGGRSGAQGRAERRRRWPTYRKALAAARDLDQVKIVTDALKKLGHPVDLAHHFGFLMDWKLLGPFRQSAGQGL